MTKRFDNFRITDTPTSVGLIFYKSIKDWLDTLRSLVLFGAVAWLAYFCIRSGLEDMKWLYLLLGAVFTFGTFLLGRGALARLFKPIGQILTIDKLTGILSIRRTIFRTLTYDINEIIGLLVTGAPTKRIGKDGGGTAAHCTIQLRMKGGEVIHLLDVNTNMVVDLDSRAVESEVYIRAKKITMELNRILKVKYTWEGFKC